MTYFCHYFFFFPNKEDKDFTDEICLHFGYGECNVHQKKKFSLLFDLSLIRGSLDMAILQSVLQL